MGIHDLKLLSLTTQTTIDQIPSSILKESMNYHFFLKWDDACNSELMFQLKRILKDTGKAYYPVSLKYLDKDYKLKVVGQLEEGNETRLYVTNWDCLHAWNIGKIYLRPKKDFFSKNKDSIHQSFKTCESKGYAWLELNDMYILHANHISGNQGLEKEISTLWSVDNFESLEEKDLDTLEPKVVIDSSGLSIFDHACDQENKVVDSKNKKWIEFNRNLTSDYFLRGCYLKDSVYQEAWDNLQKPSQHFLVEHSKLKLESANLTVGEKISSLRLSFDRYINAIICELQHYYIKPINEVIKGTPAFIEFLENNSLKEFEILEKQSNFSFIEIVDFFLNAKAIIFSLRRKLERDLDDKSLMADRILQKHEKIIEAFYRSGILQSLEELIKVQDWFAYYGDTYKSFSREEKHQFVFKINVIISRLGNSSFDENLILKIYRETNGKIVGDKKLSLLIDELKIDHSFKKAA